jgi:hypothetical protein
VGIALSDAPEDPDASTHDRFRRLQIVAAVLFVAVLGAAFVRDVLRSPDVPFLSRRDAPWIVAQTPLQTHGMEIDLAHPPTAWFERAFAVDGVRGPVTLHVRALREVTLFLNGRPLPLDPPESPDWKRARRLDLAPFLADGKNVLVARVRNPDGNPALQIWIDGLAERVETDGRWPSKWEGDPLAYAALAEDSIRHPDAELLPAPATSLLRHADVFGLLAGAGALVYVFLCRFASQAGRWAPTIALALLAGFWIVFLRKVASHPAEIGFDAAAHLEYIHRIAESRALPHPGEGSAMYHPPLYHAATAALLRPFAMLGVGERSTVSLLPMAAGFGMAIVARAMLRAVAPQRPWLEAAALLAAGLLPMNLTLASCVSNEAPYAWLASLALLVTLQALVRAQTTRRDDVLLGVLLGAAALTKYSSLLWIPVLPGALAVKRLYVERTGLLRAVTGVLLAVAIVVASAGWVYVRNAWLFGDPLVWNLNATPGRSWWQLPGFHTADYFLRFGDALTAPWFSSFHSFWDSLYSTLWGDGLLSGAIGPREATLRWRYDAMAASFLLAVPATLFVAVGWIAAARAAIRDSDLGRRLAFSLLVTLPPLFVASIASVSLRYPFWSVSKSFYALALAPTLAVLGVLGFAAFHRSLAARMPLVIQAIPHAWAAAFFGSIVWSYTG